MLLYVVHFVFHYKLFSKRDNSIFFVKHLFMKSNRILVARICDNVYNAYIFLFSIFNYNYFQLYLKSFKNYQNKSPRKFKSNMRKTDNCPWTGQASLITNLHTLNTLKQIQ